MPHPSRSVSLPPDELLPVDTGVIYKDPKTGRSHYAVVSALHDGFMQCRDVRNPRDNSFVALTPADIVRRDV